MNTSELQTLLIKGIEEIGLNASSQQITLLLKYQSLISQWNKVYNLTAIKDPHEMLSHHLLDSLAVIPYLLENTQNQAIRLMDVGSGAGLPGTVIAIMCPQIDVTCVDTVAKKAAFITQASLSLGLKNLHGIHSRVEQYKTQSFDVVCSRAFASLADFTNLTMSHVKQDTGLWFALKGKYPDDEISALAKEVYVHTHQKIIVPLLDADRCVVVLKKST